jgi:hypothetical protein
MSNEDDAWQRHWDNDQQHWYWHNQFSNQAVWESQEGGRRHVTKEFTESTSRLGSNLSESNPSNREQRAAKKASKLAADSTSDDADYHTTSPSSSPKLSRSQIQTEVAELESAESLTRHRKFLYILGGALAGMSIYLAIQHLDFGGFNSLPSSPKSTTDDNARSGGFTGDFVSTQSIANHDEQHHSKTLQPTIAIGFHGAYARKGTQTEKEGCSNFFLASDNIMKNLVNPFKGALNVDVYFHTYSACPEMDQALVDFLQVLFFFSSMYVVVSSTS